MNESNAEQADFLARHELLRGDLHLAWRCMRGIRYVFVGNCDLVPHKETEN